MLLPAVLPAAAHSPLSALQHLLFLYSAAPSLGQLDAILEYANTAQAMAARAMAAHADLANQPNWQHFRCPWLVLCNNFNVQYYAGCKIGQIRLYM